MNAQERRRRKRKKQMYRRFRILLPIVVIILLIVGLTAGGIILSINQTKKGNSPSDIKTTEQESNQIGDDENETQNEQGTDGEELDGSQEQTNEPVPNDEDIFKTMIQGIRAGLEADETYLTAANANFAETLNILQAMDTSAFSQENKDLYDVVLGYMQIESLGSAYVNNAPAAGQRMVDVEGGTDYYVWLVKKYLGKEWDMQSIHDALANEINSNYGVVNSLRQADVMIAQNSQACTKQAPDDAYRFSQVTMASDALFTELSCEALLNGWTEFGLIRAYQMDSALDDNMKNYQISLTRMSYAMYGLIDFYVHYSGWTMDQVTNLCNQYFGGGQEAFAQSLYQIILDNPGKYTAAGIGYIELVDIETTLRNNIADYSEQTLLDFLFNRGPASFGVYWKWLTPEA